MKCKMEYVQMYNYTDIEVNNQCFNTGYGWSSASTLLMAGEALSLMSART